ncbi:RHS repeat-associated core domain-containing protein [Bacteroides acidifaciens]|uniref:RHS repeat domain-containing protein n=1 Tax=Bacteroides acidifaciens TaxID=85831 RepID=UPI002577BDAC|nr:RHS repeat-associated core domain-containing protein [Bacteroides acidifaciens]
MKKNYIYYLLAALLLTLFPVSLRGQNDLTLTGSRNYVAEHHYLDATTTSGDNARRVTNVCYNDGFGRPVQKIQVKGVSGGTADLVTPYLYSPFGLVEKEYLAYPKAGNKGAFDEQSFSASNYSVYGATDAPYAFTQTEYEASPLFRPVKTVGTGKAWHDAGKGVALAYGLNATEEVRLYRISPDGTLLSDGFYAPSTLEKVTETDEDGHTVVRFTDNRGRDVLHVSVDGTDSLRIYYVYDHHDRLGLVLPPEASHRLESADATEWEHILRLFAYRYTYDSRGRVTEKRLPGCEPVRFVYDYRDRVVLTQDGRQYASSPLRWSYCVYNGMNRETENGEVTLASPLSREQLQAAYDTASDYEVAGERTPLQYTSYNTSLPGDAHPFVAADGYSSAPHPWTTGQVTGYKIRILGTDRWVTSTVYYDDKLREIYSVTTLPEPEGPAKELRHYTAYDFVGQTVKSRSELIVGGSSDCLESFFEYDDRGRLTTRLDCWNGQAGDTIRCVYDAVGRLTEKKRSNHASEHFTYNVRGWLTSHTLSGFPEISELSQKLHYTDGPGTACYNGNISSLEWATGASVSAVPRGYRFTYDGLNRLKDAIYGEGPQLQANAGRFNEQVTGYDRNGNITGLLRYGQTGTNTHGLLDNLTLTYQGNRLQSVYDNAAPSAYGSGMSFTDGANLATEYAYDENGNLTKDLNKKIVDIQYNLLNLPERVEFENGDCISYLYASDGTKLRSTYISGNDTTTISYFGPAVYENDVLAKVLTSDGYITPLDGEFHYYFCDHQGNVRAVLAQDGTVEETNDYYPFGGLLSSSTSAAASAVNSVQPYKYNGKELDRKSGLDWYDYGARWYDAVLGRWHAVDPLAESYIGLSPYSYCDSNPVNRIDPDGMDYWSTNDRNQIFSFINAVNTGMTQFDFSGWHHATDAEFLDDLVYNDEKKKFYSNYSEIINGEVNIIGVSFDANIKPVTFSGFGYKGAFVYEPLKGFWLKANHFLEGTQYFDGIVTWQVNLDGRITGLAPKIGFPPLVGKGKGFKVGSGKSSTKGMPHGDGGRALTQAEKRIMELEKQLQTATGKEKKELTKKIINIRKNAERKAKGETHWRK